MSSYMKTMCFLSNGSELKYQKSVAVGREIYQLLTSRTGRRSENSFTATVFRQREVNIVYLILYNSHSVQFAHDDGCCSSKFPRCGRALISTPVVIDYFLYYELGQLYSIQINQETAI